MAIPQTQALENIVDVGQLTHGHRYETCHSVWWDRVFWGRQGSRLKEQTGHFEVLEQFESGMASTEAENMACSFTLSKEILRSLRDRQVRAAGGSSEHYLQCVNLTSPLATGLSNAHASSTGFSFLDPYGVPYLPGSSIRGALRRAAEELALLDEESQWSIVDVLWLFGFDSNAGYFLPTGSHDEKSVEAEAERVLLVEAFEKVTCRALPGERELGERLGVVEPVETGHAQKGEPGGGDGGGETGKWVSTLVVPSGQRRKLHFQGYLRCDDGFPEPPPERGLMQRDIVNVHHQAYYEAESFENNEKAEPSGSGAPKPSFFLTIVAGANLQISLRVPKLQHLPKHLREDDKWRSLLSEALEHCGDSLGFGAKTSVGYGAFELSRAEVAPDR